jgi:hypothetical protein
LPSPANLCRSTDSDTFNRVSHSKHPTRRAAARMFAILLWKLLTRCLREKSSRSGSILGGLQPTETRCLFPRPSKPNSIDISLRRATLYPAELRVQWSSFSRLVRHRQRPLGAGWEGARPKGTGHTFESCRVRQESTCRACRDCGGRFARKGDWE